MRLYRVRPGSWPTTVIHMAWLRPSSRKPAASSSDAMRITSR